MRSAFTALEDRPICHICITHYDIISRFHFARSIIHNTAKVEVIFCVRGVISPLLGNLYLNDVDKMLEQAKAVTQHRQWTEVEYARFADDMVVLVSAHPKQRWLQGAVEKRLRGRSCKQVFLVHSKLG